jgi:hypothetical protein
MFWPDVFIEPMVVARRTFRSQPIHYSLGDGNQPVCQSQRSELCLRWPEGKWIRGHIGFCFSTASLRDIHPFISVQKFFKKVKKRLVSPDFCS